MKRILPVIVVALVSIGLIQGLRRRKRQGLATRVRDGLEGSLTQVISNADELGGHAKKMRDKARDQFNQRIGDVGSHRKQLANRVEEAGADADRLQEVAGR